MVSRLPGAGVVVIRGLAISGLKIVAGVALLKDASVGEPRPLRSDAHPDLPRTAVASKSVRKSETTRVGIKASRAAAKGGKPD